MKNIWQKILRIFKSEEELPRLETKDILTCEIIQRFISYPETFTLYRGESKGRANEDGLHFTTDKKWAKGFGDILLEGSLPKGSVIHQIDESDFTEALGIYSRIKKMDDKTIFELQLSRHNYDAMVGHDPMICNILDVVVNPRNLKYFKPSKLD